MAKIRSFGAKLYLNGIELGGITDIQATGVDVSFIDTTSHDESSGFRTFVSGLKDGGTLEVTGKYNYADDGQAEWKAEEGIRHAFHIILSDNSGIAFEAIVGGFQTSNPLDDAVEFTATAKITGEVFPVFPTMTVTGSLTDGTDPVVFPSMAYFEQNGGKCRYSVIVSNSVYSIYWDESKWWLESATVAEGVILWNSTADVPTPDLVPSGEWHETTNPHAWKPVSPATGTPVVTGS